MQEVLDIDQIMSEIKKRAKERDYREIPEFERFYSDTGPDSEFDLAVMQDEIWLMMTECEITTEIPDSKGGAKGAAKKVIRKANRFWAEPMIAQQTGFNEAVVRVCHQLESYIVKQQRIIESLENRIRALEEDSDHQEAGQDI